MKTLYFDSSYLFRLYSQEPGHEEVKALLTAGYTVASAYHARAEFAAVVFRHRREQRASADSLFELHGQFLDECRQGHIRLLPLSPATYALLESTLRQVSSATTFLRAADALHLASAAENGFKEVYSNDRHFLHSAPLFGLRGLNVIPVSA